MFIDDVDMRNLIDYFSDKSLSDEFSETLAFMKAEIDEYLSYSRTHPNELCIGLRFSGKEAEGIKRLIESDIVALEYMDWSEEFMNTPCEN